MHGENVEKRPAKGLGRPQLGQLGAFIKQILERDTETRTVLQVTANAVNLGAAAREALVNLLVEKGILTYDEYVERISKISQEMGIDSDGAKRPERGQSPPVEEDVQH